jgi:hypothetical protein
VGVPNIEKFGMGHLQNAHTYYFSPKTLRYYMAKCGLKMVYHHPELKWHMFVIFIKEDSGIDDSFLNGHYEEMSGKIKKYCRLRYLKYLFKSLIRIS